MLEKNVGDTCCREVLENDSCDGCGCQDKAFCSECLLRAAATQADTKKIK